MTCQAENTKAHIKSLIKSAIPVSLKERLRKGYDTYILRCPPPIGRVRFGDLRRLQPISNDYGLDRGQGISRYYTDKFLNRYAIDVRGRVLEIGDDRYTKQYGKDKVTQSDVLHYTEGNPQATIVADLTKADNIAANIFDCIIITMTLQMIYDVRSAIQHLYRILKPNGVLLAASHGSAKKVGRVLGKDQWGEYWRFTGQSSQMMFEEFFGSGHVTVETYGNVLTAASFLYGLAVEDLKTHELDYQDPEFEVLIGVRAVKAANN